MTKIINFSIIAHIDHGKSTISDRIIQICNNLDYIEECVLDSMDLEKEKGITIKSQTVRLFYKGYMLNLVDTPGHVDFGNEVSRFLRACESSLLIVDASQGIEAQTFANVYKAIEAHHEILPVLNKIDLPAAEPERVKSEIENLIGLDTDNASLVSGKTGFGINEMLDSMIANLPTAKIDLDAPLKALLIDSYYDKYLGVVLLIRIMDGVVKLNDKIHFINSNVTYNVERLGYFTPAKIFCDTLKAGEIGFMTASIKNLGICQVGDTITLFNRKCAEVIPGFEPINQVVFCTIFPEDSGEFDKLKVSIQKLHLNDVSFCYEMITTTALGVGFKCGFLGLLHMEIIQERLRRDYDMDIIMSAPSVVYKITLNDHSVIELSNAADLPEPHLIKIFEEPWTKVNILVREKYLGPVMTLCSERRGVLVHQSFEGERFLLEYELPLNEIIFDFHDTIKSISSGYASFDWKMHEYRPGNLVKVTILINAEPVDALTFIIDKGSAEAKGREICKKLLDLIPRQMFTVPIQAAIGGRIIARETIKAFRKDVTAKCYGGDVTRKKKLLEKQKAGKKRMREIGKVTIPSNTFIEVLKIKKTET